MNKGFKKVLDLLAEKYGPYKPSTHFHHAGWKFKDFALVQTTWYGAIDYEPNEAIRELLDHCGFDCSLVTLLSWKTHTESHHDVHSAKEAFEIVDKHHSKLKALISKAGEQ